ncbi:MAG: hypothetical protein COA52_10905, partial [Hyphomicrobiales bacterium]
SSAAGELVFHVFGAIAHFERRLISERTIMAILFFSCISCPLFGFHHQSEKHKVRCANQPFLVLSGIFLKLF